MSEADIRDERLKKLQRLREAGVEPYPSNSERTAPVADFLATFDEREKNAESATLSGRIMSLRGQGGITFADLFDGSGRVQIVLQKAEMDESAFALFATTVDIGDFAEFTGSAIKTKRGEQSLKAASWRILSKSLLPIPDEWYGVKDDETRLRHRYLDILLNPGMREMFERRSAFWQAIRNFYISHGFLEVETPVLETSPGGADARPFVTHHNALDIDVFLRISAGELWQKRLLIAGFPKIFEIGRIFRNEGQSREHLQDYTQLESYEAYEDMRGGMTFVQELYRAIAKEVYGQYTFTIGEHSIDLAEQWQVIHFSEILKERYGIDPRTCSQEDAIRAASGNKTALGDSPNKIRALDSLWKQIRKTVSGPAFLTGIPVALEPLAKRSLANPDEVERIQVILAGSEMGKGYSELNDPLDQAARFEEQQTLRDAGDEEAQRLDSDYIRAMEHGMPPAFGFGVSERLFAFLENKPVHEAQLFPLLRPKS